MISLAEASALLDGPRRSASAVTASIAKRLDALSVVEAELRRREQDCAVREAVFRRAVAAGPRRESEAQLLRWVEDDVLPGLPTPPASAHLLAELEARAVELDERMLQLDARELLLAHREDAAGRRAAELRVREEEVDRRGRDVTASRSAAEAGVESAASMKSQIELQVDALRATERDTVVTEERVDRQNIAGEAAMCLAAGFATLQLAVAKFADHRADLVAARSVASRLASHVRRSAQSVRDFHGPRAPGTSAMEHHDAACESHQTREVATQSDEVKPSEAAGVADLPQLRTSQTSDRVVCVASVCEADAYDEAEETRVREQVAAAARTATYEAELRQLLGYVQAQRSVVDARASELARRCRTLLRGQTDSVVADDGPLTVHPLLEIRSH